jgi:hypothetical protein
MGLEAVEVKEIRFPNSIGQASPAEANNSSAGSKFSYVL